MPETTRPGSAGQPAELNKTVVCLGILVVDLVGKPLRSSKIPRAVPHEPAPMTAMGDALRGLLFAGPASIFFQVRLVFGLDRCRLLFGLLHIFVIERIEMNRG